MTPHQEEEEESVEGGGEIAISEETVDSFTRETEERNKVEAVASHRDFLWKSSSKVV